MAPEQAVIPIEKVQLNKGGMLKLYRCEILEDDFARPQVKLAQTMNPKSDNVVVINEAIIQKQAETVTNSPKKNLSENVKNQSEIIKLAL